MICQDKPNLSSSHPHRTALPPAASTRSQSRSTSSWLSQDTKSEIAGVNLCCGPPFNAKKVWPASSKTMFMTLPSGAGPPLPQRATLVTRVRKERRVVLDGLLGVAVKPEISRDLLGLFHDHSPCAVCLTMGRTPKSRSGGSQLDMLGRFFLGG